MTELIEQLKAAETGSWELDAAIWLRVTTEQHPDVRLEDMRQTLGFEPSDGAKKMVWDCWNHSMAFPPKFTQSVNTAMSLKPANANTIGLEENPNECMAYVQRNNVESGHWSCEAEAKTLPLAICIACLIAIQAHPV